MVLALREFTTEGKMLVLGFYSWGIVDLQSGNIRHTTHCTERLDLLSTLCLLITPDNHHKSKATIHTIFDPLSLHKHACRLLCLWGSAVCWWYSILQQARKVNDQTLRMETSLMDRILNTLFFKRDHLPWRARQSRTHKWRESHALFWAMVADTQGEALK